jgi:hypothetical protein
MPKNSKVDICIADNMAEYRCSCGFIKYCQARAMPLIVRLHKKTNPLCFQINNKNVNVRCEERMMGMDTKW